ncbi:TetR/AcrR family transcriptional regulator [Nocardioides sp. MH1]|uniref:TetR/AcrR family transcriptional regulator n=1 Tax=Nocardioides sp. MH1 TaxID=3242490 RepID=UPI0035204FB0
MTATTRDKLLDATIRVLAEQGIAKASARTVATAAGVNQALVFYHFGSVDELLAAACEHGARTRVEANRAALDAVTTLPQLVEAARHIHASERDAGHVALLGQLLAGAPSHPSLSAATAAGLSLWIAEVERVLQRVLAPTVLAELVDVPGLARAISSSFVGLELYEGVDPDGADQAFASLDALAALITVLTELGPIEERALRRKLRRRP